MTVSRGHVLMAGPSPRGAGGMASVAQALASGCAAPTSAWSCALLDSGGGRGRRGYARFGKAIAVVASQRYDLLHLHVASKGSTARKAVLAEIAARRGIPYVIHLHGGGYVQFLDACGPHTLAGVRRFFLRAAQVVVLGETWRELVVIRLGVPPHRVRVVRNGVPPVLEGWPGTQVVDAGRETAVLFIGELSRHKGADLLIDALGDVMGNAQFDHVTAAFVGSTPDADLLDLARRLSEETGGRVEIAGQLFGEEKAARFARAAVLALPSRSEALPMVLLEAMSAAIPCITTEVGSITEIFPNGPASGAIVLQRPDVVLLRDALVRLLADPDERRHVGRAGLNRWASAFTAAAMFEGMQDCWAAATQSQPAVP